MKSMFVPWKQVEIRSYTVYDTVEELLNLTTAPVPQNTPAQTALLWGNGVLFRHAPLAPSETLSRLHVEGRLIWDNLDLAEMPTHLAELHPASKPMVTVQVIDVSKSTLFGPLTQWMSKELIGIKEDSHRKKSR